MCKTTHTHTHTHCILYLYIYIYAHTHTYSTCIHANTHTHTHSCHYQFHWLHILTQQWECNSKHKDDDSPKHIDDQISCSQDDEHTDQWVVALKLASLPLVVGAIDIATKCHWNCCKPKYHLHRVDNPKKKKKREENKKHRHVNCDAGKKMQSQRRPKDPTPPPHPPKKMKKKNLNNSWQIHTSL